MNKKMIDKNGNQIKEGMKVKIYQKGETYMDLPFKDQEDANEMAEMFTTMEDNGKVYTYENIKDNIYRLYEDGAEKEYEAYETTFEKNAFMMESEHDIPEMEVKKGDQVLCFGFEGGGAGVFRFNEDSLEIK